MYAGINRKELDMQSQDQNAELNPGSILQIAFGFAAAKTLLSAVELNLFTELSPEPMDAATIGTKLGLHQRALRDFLDALVSLHLLERDETGLYSNSKAADAFLDRNKPGYIGGMLEMANARLYGFWGSLTEALRTGQPQNEVKKNDGGLFDALYADPARLESFLK